MILVNLLVFNTQTYHIKKDEMLKLTEICSATHWLWIKKSVNKKKKIINDNLWSSADRRSFKDKLPASN